MFSKPAIKVTFQIHDIQSFAAKEIFRDFVTEYPVSDRSFDQITRVLGILGELQGVVEMAMQEKDREIEKLVELVEANESRSQIVAESAASATPEPGTLDPAVHEYTKLVKLCKVGHSYVDPPVKHSHTISRAHDVVSPPGVSNQ